MTHGTAVCRHCIRNARYPSQRKNAEGRALTRFLKLRNRVRPGTEECATYYFPRRPRRMRKETYEQLRAKAWDALAKYQDAQDRRLIGVFARFAVRHPEAGFAELLGVNAP